MDNEEVGRRVLQLIDTKTGTWRNNEYAGCGDPDERAEMIGDAARVAPCSTHGEPVDPELLTRERAKEERYGRYPGEKDLSHIDFNPDAVKAVLEALRDTNW